MSLGRNATQSVIDTSEPLMMNVVLWCDIYRIYFKFTCETVQDKTGEVI